MYISSSAESEASWNLRVCMLLVLPSMNNARKLWASFNLHQTIIICGWIFRYFVWNWQKMQWSVIRERLDCISNERGFIWISQAPTGNLVQKRLDAQKFVLQKNDQGGSDLFKTLLHYQLYQNHSKLSKNVLIDFVIIVLQCKMIHLIFPHHTLTMIMMMMTWTPHPNHHPSKNCNILHTVCAL